MSVCIGCVFVTWLYQIRRGAHLSGQKKVLNRHGIEGYTYTQKGHNSQSYSPYMLARPPPHSCALSPNSPPHEIIMKLQLPIVNRSIESMENFEGFFFCLLCLYSKIKCKTINNGSSTTYGFGSKPNCSHCCRLFEVDDICIYYMYTHTPPCNAYQISCLPRTNLDGLHLAAIYR